MERIGNWDEFKTVEKVKLSYLKNRGELFSIVKDLGWPEDKEHVEYVQKLIKKFRGAEDKDVSVLISHNLMTHVLMGTQSRCLHLMELLKSLDKSEKPFVSICCNSPFKTTHDSFYGTQHRCSSCKATCEVHQPPKATIYKIKLDLLEQLREEDLALVEMADKMGYTNKVETPTTIINHKPQVLVISDGRKKEQDVIDDYTKLSPMDRERLIEKLRKEIVKSEKDEPPPVETAKPEVPPSPDPLQQSN